MIIWDDAQSQLQTWTNDTDATVLTSHKFWMNHYYKDILADFARALIEKTKRATVVKSQQGYQMPPDVLFPKVIKYTSGSRTYVLEEEESEEYWSQINSFSREGVPRIFFYRPRFGVKGGLIELYPIPSNSTDTLTIIYEAGDKDLSVDKVTAGTITSTNGSATITGSGTSFSSAMVGRYFKSTGGDSDGQHYRIAGASGSTLTLENVYEGTSESGATHQVAEAFSLPEEMQILPMLGAAAEYYNFKKDTEEYAKYLSRYERELADAKRRYGTKTRSNIVRSKSGFFRKGRTYPGHFPQTIT